MKKAVIFDLDGTIYYGNKLIEGAKNTLEKLEKLDYEIIFFTNNSSKSRNEIFSKLVKLDISTSLDKVYSSSYATSIYLKENNYKKLFVIGTTSFKKELMSFGMDLVNPLKSEVVVIGLDFEFKYDDISNALLSLQNGSSLVVCNVDKNFPIEDGVLMPGCNAIVASLVGSCSKDIKPIVIGKPNTYMLKIICKDWGLKKEDIWVVGDSYESDIKMAKNFGCRYVLVGENAESIENIVERVRDECS